MTLLHTPQYICIVFAQYQKASVKPLVQVHFPVYALSKHKRNMHTGKMHTGKNGYYKVHKTSTY